MECFSVPSFFLRLEDIIAHAPDPRLTRSYNAAYPSEGVTVVSIKDAVTHEPPARLAALRLLRTMAGVFNCLIHYRSQQVTLSHCRIGGLKVGSEINVCKN
jgi:hypothetical protein